MMFAAMPVSSNDLEALSEELDLLHQFISGLPEKIINFGIKFALTILLLFVGGKVIGGIRKILKKSLLRFNAEQGVVQFLDSFAKFGLYLLLIVWIASYFGVETTSLVAILGSAGVTLALALQGSLSNFTGGVLILLLKPFKVGDYIIEDNKNNEGTVTEIQLFYTKLRTIDDKIVILPNGTLANTSLINVTESPVRRVVMKIGISYDSNIKDVKQILEDLIHADSRVVKNKEINIYVDEMGDSSVIIGVRFFAKSEEYWQVKWDMTEKIMEAFANHKIRIPYPQMDVHLDK